MSVGSILILCTGNICRSPMAEALLSLRLTERGVRVESAGIGAVVGAPADPLAARLMAGRGLDVSGHRARQISGALGIEFDLHLVMDAEQRRFIETRWPLFRGRVHELGQHGGFDIEDPYGRPAADFGRALDLIDRGIEQWLPRLQR